MRGDGDKIGFAAVEFFKRLLHLVELPGKVRDLDLHFLLGGFFECISETRDQRADHLQRLVVGELQAAHLVHLQHGFFEEARQVAGRAFQIGLCL